MKKRNLTGRLAAGLFLLSAGLPLGSCVDDSYDMSKDIDLTMGLGSEGLQLKLGSTQRIMMADLLEVDDDLKTEGTPGLYYLTKGGRTSVEFKVNTMSAFIDNAKLSPSYEVLNYDDIVPAEAAGMEYTVPAGHVFDLDEPVEAVTEFGFDLSGIQQDVKWVKGLDLSDRTNQMKLYLEIEGSGMDGLVLKDIRGLQINFPDFLYLSQPSNGKLDATGRVLTLDNRTNINNNHIDLGTVRIDHVAFQGEDGKIDGGSLRLAGKHISMKGALSFTTARAVTLHPGAKANVRLTISVGERHLTQSEVELAEVTGRFDPLIEPQVEQIDITSSLPDFLRDESVTVKVANPTMKFHADLSQVPLTLQFHAKLASVKDGASTARVELPALGEGKVDMKKHTDNTFYFYQKGEPYDPDGLASGAQTRRVPGLGSLIEKLPDYISVDLNDRQVNVKDEDHTIKLGNTYRAEVGYDVLVPFEFEQGLSIVYNDSVVDMNEDLRDYEADGLCVTAVISNAVPLDLEATLVPVGVDGKVLDHISVDKVAVAAARSGEGLTVDGAAVDSEVTINVKFQNPADLKKLDRLRFRVAAAANAPQGGALRSDQFIQVKDMRLRLIGQIIGNFN